MRFCSIQSLGDCTDVYVIIFDHNESYTVGEFMSTILNGRGKEEWGYFRIDSTIYSITYKDGSFINTDNPIFDEEILATPVKTVQANGGWSRMDYRIFI